VKNFAQFAIVGVLLFLGGAVASTLFFTSARSCCDQHPGPMHNGPACPCQCCGGCNCGWLHCPANPTPKPTLPKRKTGDIGDLEPKKAVFNFGIDERWLEQRQQWR
jgi:hypothetical protein